MIQENKKVKLLLSEELSYDNLYQLLYNISIAIFEELKIS